MKRAIFLDRDGVICKDQNQRDPSRRILTPEDFEWEENAREGLQKLAGLEYSLIVITNQSIIGEGLLDVEMFHKINQPIYEELAKYGKELDGFYFCPHVPKDCCACRKPRLGMMMQARDELKIEWGSSLLIGDKTSDIKMGIDAGCKTILVRTGYGGRDNAYNVKPDYVASDLLEAAEVIVQ